MTPLAFSHNPDDLVDWIWVVLAYGIVALVLAVGIALVVRAVLAARSSARDRERTRR